MSITLSERNMNETSDLHVTAGPLLGLAMAMVAMLVMAFA
jgi:hypothetical protein